MAWRGPRSRRSVRMFLGLYEEGPLHARELAPIMGLRSSRHVFPYASYWARRGFLRMVRGIGGWLYMLGVRGRMLVGELQRVWELREPDEAALRILLRRLQAKGLRDRVYRDVVRALYYMVKDKDNTPYVRARTAEDLARVFLAALRDKGYSEDEILEALELLAEAGVVELNRPSRRIRSWAVAFTHGFAGILGIPTAPVNLGGPPGRRA